jgi:hypothetical protein
LFAGGANGGVFRKKLNNLADPSDDGAWEPISDGILSLSTGDLEYHDGALWYATGDVTGWKRVGGNSGAAGRVAAHHGVRHHGRS